MAYENNHFVPQLILRRYGDRINRYNLKNDEYFVNGNIRNCFSCKNLYPKELEIKLCDVESRFANLLNNKILPAKDELILYRGEISLIKKFLLLQMFRVPESLVEQEGSKDNSTFCEKIYGFKEKVIPNETFKEYVFRTMNLIIDCKDFEELLEREDKTYLAVKWALLYQACYLTIYQYKPYHRMYKIYSCKFYNYRSWNDMRT